MRPTENYRSARLCFLPHEHDFLSFSVLAFVRGILEHRVEDRDRISQSRTNFTANFRVPAAVFG